MMRSRDPVANPGYVSLLYPCIYGTISARDKRCSSAYYPYHQTLQYIYADRLIRYQNNRVWLVFQQILC